MPLVTPGIHGPNARAYMCALRIHCAWRFVFVALAFVRRAPVHRVHDRTEQEKQPRHRAARGLDLARRRERLATHTLEASHRLSCTH